MKITKKEYKRILELDPNFFNEKLEVGRWYKYPMGSIICYTGDLYNSYGISQLGNCFKNSPPVRSLPQRPRA